MMNITRKGTMKAIGGLEFAGIGGFRCFFLRHQRRAGVG